MDKTDKLEACPPDLITFKWAETLSTGEQSVLLTSSLKRLQTMIDSSASVAAPPPDAAIFTDDELEYLYLQTDVDADPDLFRGIEKKIRRQIARYREFDRNENMNRLVFSEEESNATAAAPTNAACPKCGGTKPTCCSCPSPVAATVDAEAKAKEIADYLFTNGFGDKGDRLNLYRNGDVYLGGWDEDSVVRGIVSYLNDYTAQPAPSDSSIQARHYFCSCGGALTAEEYIEHYFEKGHDRGDPAFQSKQT